MRGSTRLGAAAAVAALVVIVLSGGAGATLPGTNGLIAFTSESGLFVVNPDGTGVREVDAGPDEYPSWSPDGSEIAFGEVTPNANTDDDVYTINLDGSSKTQLTDNAEHDYQAAWSPDGSEIAFFSSRFDQDVWVMDADGANQRLLVHNARFPAWSPDGSKIAVTSDVNQHLMLANADGTNVQDLGITGAWPSWSPDGTKIVYASNSDLYVLNADGTGNPMRITNTPGLIEQQSTWSPDGRKIAYPSFDPSAGFASTLYVSDADGSNPVNITRTPGGFNGNVFEVSWQTLPAVPASDSDGDGIRDAVDTDPTHASATFDDAAGTSGTITDRPGLTVTVADAAASNAGVHVTVGAGGGVATLSVCASSVGGPFTVTLAAGSEADITCGSVRVAVATGEARVILGGGVTTVTIPAGADAKLAGATGGTYSVQVFSAPAQPVTLSVDGTQSSLSAGTTTPTAPWHFVGFSQPIDNSGVLNIAKAGRVIPIKWRVLDAANQPVTTLASVKLSAATLACSTGATTDQIEEYAAGNSGLQNLGNGYYQFNWATPTTYANSCKTANLEIGDGVKHKALFSFTK